MTTTTYKRLCENWQGWLNESDMDMLRKTKKNLLLEIDAQQNAAATEISQAAKSNQAAAQEFNSSLLGKEKETAAAVNKMLEAYVGIDHRLWHEKSGKLKPEVMNALNKMYKELNTVNKIGKDLKKASGANMPVEEMIKGYATASKYAAVGTGLGAAIGIWSSTVGPSVGLASGGAGISGWFAGLGSGFLGLGVTGTAGVIGTSVFTAPALFFAGAAFLLYLTAKLIKESKEKWDDLQATSSAIVPGLQFAAKAGMAIFSGMGTALKGTFSLIKKAWAKVKDMFDADDEEISKEKAVSEINQLNEILSFKDFYKSSLLS